MQCKIILCATADLYFFWPEGFYEFLRIFPVTVQFRVQVKTKKKSVPGQEMSFT